MNFSEEVEALRMFKGKINAGKYSNRAQNKVKHVLHLRWDEVKKRQEALSASELVAVVSATIDFFVSNFSCLLAKTNTFEYRCGCKCYHSRGWRKQTKDAKALLSVRRTKLPFYHFPLFVQKNKERNFSAFNYLP